MILIGTLWFAANLLIVGSALRTLQIWFHDTALGEALAYAY